MMRTVATAARMSNLHAIRRLSCVLLILVLVLSAVLTGGYQQSIDGYARLEENSIDGAIEDGFGSLPAFPATQEDTTQGHSANERTRGSDGSAEEVVFNELMLFPAEGGPWVELYNAGNESGSVDDWLISDEDGLTYQLGDLPEMPSGSYIVVHFDDGESETYFGQSQPNALHLYTGWKNVRWTPHIVDSDVHYIRMAVGHDITLNGRPEIVANRFGGNSVYLYEPQADMTLEWLLSPILDTGATHRLKPIDVDADGHTDLVYDYYFGNEAGGKFSIHWMQAPLTSPKDPWAGPFPISQIRRPEGLDAGRIDGDNVLDIVAGGKFNNEIFWYQSPANPAGDPWIEHDIDINFNQPGGLKLVDLDTDGDLDLVAVGSYGEEVVWYEHPVNPVNAWPKHTIAPLVGQPSPDTCSEFDATGELVVGDLDDDQKLDVVISEAQRNRIVWYKYAVDPTGVWTPYVIDDDVASPSGLDLGDIDNDGDVDVIAAATGGYIAWYPQPSSGPYDPNWPRYIVDDSVQLAFYVNATDLDSDGDLDIVAADQSDSTVLWFENEFLEFTAQDQAALFNSTERVAENITDFVAWGGPSLGEDALAVNAGMWQDDTFVDMTDGGPNQTLARNRYSSDDDLPGDWDPQNGTDSDIPMPGMVNYPYPTNIQLSVEYNPVVFAGGSDAPESMPSGLCLANYSSYTFSVNVSNPFGWDDLVDLELVLDPNGTGIRLVWTQADNNITIYNANNFVALLWDASSAWTDGVYDWHVNFTVFFHWWYPSEGLLDATVASQNAHGYNDTDFYDDKYRLVKRLRLVDQMLVRVQETGQPLAVGGWVIPSLQLEVSGPVVIYDVQDVRYYPADSQFNVILRDNRGSSWTDYTSAGYPVDFLAQVPEDATTGPYSLTIALADLPNGAIGQGEVAQGLNVDAGLLQYDTPSPGDSVWNVADPTECGVSIADLVPGSGVAGYSIEYRVANGSVDRFGEWTPAPIMGTGGVLAPDVICDFPDGADNWIQWRAKDVAGNGPTVSPAFRVPVDAHGVTYHDFYPPRTIVQQEGAVTVNITLADFGGSGVDIGTLQVAVKPLGEAAYGNWFEPDFTVLDQTAPTSEILQSGPETIRVSISIAGFQNGTLNYVKFRVLDLAGNGPTESEEFNIHMSPPTVDSDDTVLGAEAIDLWWIIPLVSIILVLLAATVFNRRRKVSPSPEEEPIETPQGTEPEDERDL